MVMCVYSKHQRREFVGQVWKNNDHYFKEKNENLINLLGIDLLETLFWQMNSLPPVANSWQFISFSALMHVYNQIQWLFNSPPVCITHWSVLLMISISYTYNTSRGVRSADILKPALCIPPLPFCLLDYMYSKYYTSSILRYATHMCIALILHKKFSVVFRPLTIWINLVIF